MSLMCSPLILAFGFVFNTCFLLASQLDFPGETTPRRLEIGIGSSANITCRMNLDTFEGEDSSSLYFTEDDTKNRVPQNQIAIVNASTAVFMLQNAREQSRSYTCMSGKNGIAITHVDVGTPPLEVEHFKCRAFDYQYMVCNFTVPPNKVYTLYKLEYYVTNPHYIQKCEIERNGSYALCKISKEDNQYKPLKKYYNFNLTAFNPLGTRNQSFRINHYESVIPPEPMLRLIKVRNDSVSFRWRMDYTLYKNALRYELHLHPDKFRSLIYTNFNVHGNISGYYLVLNDLPYAYYNYTISLRLRVNSEQQDEDLWSEVHYHSFTTASCLPDAPPTTDFGSFDLIDATKPRVRLYWEQRPFYRENGPNFRYVITQVRRDGFAIDLSPLQIDRTSAIFDWDRSHEYEFVIKSRNDIGDSVESSVILVPALGMKRILDYSPDWIRNIYHESNRTYSLSWNPPPAQHNELVDYTVFWCTPKLATTNECNDTIKFKHLNKHITKYTTEPQKHEQTLTLAVSANYANFTTGMHWTMCAGDISSTLTKLEPELKAISAREIDVQWSLECVFTSVLEGYNLTYCPVESSDTIDCLHTNARKTVTIERKAKNFRLRHLRPFTSYRIEMFMFSKLNTGKTSDPHTIQTKEAAPTPPRNLTSSNITSNSVFLSWMPPAEANGIIRYYTVVVENNQHHKIFCNQIQTSSCGSPSNPKIEFKLKLLSSYTNYTVYVTAHTVEDSMPSNELKVTTLVGFPSSPHVETKNDTNSVTILQWTQPNVTSDRVDFYEVSIRTTYNDKTEVHIYGIIAAAECSINIPKCQHKDQKNVITVTAVTAASRAKNEIDLELLNRMPRNDVFDLDGIGQQKVLYHTDSEELRCIATAQQQQIDDQMQRKKWQSFYKSNQYVLYRTNGDNSKEYGCLEWQSNIVIFGFIAIAVGVLLGVLVLKFSYDRYKRDSKIKAVLPPLIAGISNGNEGFSPSSQQHARDFLDEVYLRNGNKIKNSHNNEHKRLLITDSGFLDGYGGGCGGNGDPSAIGLSTPPVSIGSRSSGYDGNSTEKCFNDYCNSDIFSKQKLAENGHNLTAKAATTNPEAAYAIMEMRKPCAITSSEQLTFSDGYVPPSQLEADKKLTASFKPYTTMSPTNVVEMSSTLPLYNIPRENCYVKPNQIFKGSTQQSPLRNSASTTPTAVYGSALNTPRTSHMPNISSSGYVERPTSNLDKTAVSPAYVSYTTIDALNKRDNTTATATSTFQPPVPPSMGYVTHKELSALGQQRFS